MSLDPRFAWRPATASDIPALEALMQRAIRELLTPWLPPDQVEASFAIMGLDRQLIDDGTYFVVTAGDAIAGSGGWSARATLFGGDHTAGRDAARLDPQSDAARVRAMYTDPAFARLGIGRFLLEASERAAAAQGFRRTQLAATLAGLPLYRACGYREIEHFREATPTGISVPLVRMEKQLAV